MQNVKDRALVRMLGCLSQKQRKGFGDFLKCSLFNTNPSLEIFYQLLENRALSEKVNYLSDEELLKGSGINPRLVDKLSSKLLGLLNRFVALWEKTADPRSDFGIAFDAWYRMGLEPELLEREYRKMKRKFEKMPPGQFDSMYDLQLEHVYAQYQAGKPRKKHQQIYDSLDEQLEQFYLLTRLKYLCARTSAGKIFERDAAPEFFELTETESRLLPDIGQAYFSAYLLLREARPGIEEAEALFARLEDAGIRFARMDRIDLYGYLLNCCIRKLSAAVPGIDGLVYRVYNALLAHKLLPIGEFIPGGHFKNIVSIKVRVGEVGEARQFIADYQGYLKTDEKEILLKYVHGLVHFHSREFREAITHFRSIVVDSPEDLFWGLEARNMLWKSHYEAYDQLSMGEHEEMLHLYDSFRVFVRRNKRISPRHRTSYENFIRIFNRLIRIRDRNLKIGTKEKLVELNALSEMASQAEFIVHKKWLLQVIEQRILTEKKDGQG